MISTEGVDETVRDLGQAPGQMVRRMRPVFRKAGVEMKRKMQADFRTSRSFRPVARSVDFDFFDTTAFTVRNMRVEVGPNAHRAPSAALAGIAYFGGSRGGGGTVPEPDSVLENEADTAIGHIEKLIRDVL